MNSQALYEEAKECRRMAHSYLGQPEASVLLRVAREFERLAIEVAPRSQRRADTIGEKRRLG